jgi:hypothetical protein
MKAKWVEWIDLKEKPGVLDYNEDGKEYEPYKIDGIRSWFTSFLKSEYATEGTDCKDFYDNFKSDIDINKPALEHRSDDSRQMVYSSTRKDGSETYFSGAGDHSENGIGEGVRLLFNMTASDPTKDKEISFNESVDIKDVFIICTEAPIGAYAHIEYLDSQDAVIGRYSKYYNLLGTVPIPLNTEGRGTFPNLAKIKITIGNSDGAKSDQEAAKSFKAVVNFEVYRANTI